MDSMTPRRAAAPLALVLTLAGWSAVAQTIPGSVAPVGMGPSAAPTPTAAAPAPATTQAAPRRIDLRPAEAKKPLQAPASAQAAPSAGQAQGVAPAQGSGQAQSLGQSAPAPTPAPQEAAPAPAGVEPAPAPAAHPPPPKAAAKKAAPPPAPRETALPETLEPSFTPDTFYATAKASERYAAIADAGGWPTVVALSPGAKGKAVATLRQRLAAEGDLSPDKAVGEAYDADVKAAVQAFQERHGLKRSGAVAGATLKAMNVPAAARFRQLVSSAQRLAGYMFAFGDKYVIVNIPSASVEAVQGGTVAHRYVAVVGDVKHPSPEVEAKIGAINLNPTWTVPVSIIKNEIIPKMQKDPGYLSRANIRILDGQGREVDAREIDWSTQKAVNYTLRQDSGKGNALGDIRIAMPNKHAVYMHDTPTKSFFARDYRFASHGCVRVQGVYDLAEWLLQGSRAGMTKEQILARIATGAREDVRLAQPVPVAWVYLTGWASRDGAAHFRSDVYGWDSIGPGDPNEAIATR
jgi:murein L,D-transpeptidase YcbB/YkuD